MPCLVSRAIKQCFCQDLQPTWRWSALSVVASMVFLLCSGYNPEAGDSVLKNVAGAAYVALVVVFFYRLLTKRAKTGTTQVDWLCCS